MNPHDGLKVGERRTATLLFSDMKGFTSLSERMDPEEMDALMGRIFGLFEDIIRERGGMVEKYIGDALVAVFGVPELHEDDASRAIDAAFEFLSRLREDLATSVPGGIAFRTGIHTGLVTTGKRGEFDVVTGHAMSVAQRLEAAAAPDTILVSEETRAAAEHDFEFAEEVDINAKGKVEAIRAFVVKGRAERELNDEGPFIGRREELDTLLKSYLRHDGARAAGFLLTGEAGIGKTRLAQALVDKLRLFPDFGAPVLAARALKNRPGSVPVIVDIILDYLGLAASASEGAVLSALERFEGVDEDGRRLFSGLCCAGEAAARDPRVTAVLYSLLATIVERHEGGIYPLLVVIDNAPDMDEFSRSFFRYFLRNSKKKPFFILTGREFSLDLRKAYVDLTTLRLSPLPPVAASALVRTHWPDLSPEQLSRILEAGLGNPLFLREYARWARDHRDASSLPAGVQNIFLATIERYPALRRDLVKKLSVFLHSFTVEEARYIEESTSGSPDEVGRSLEIFVADGLLADDGKGNWFFRNDAFKKALYTSLLNHNKRILHGLVADLLLSREKPNRPRLVAHLIRAGRMEEATRVIREDPSRTYTWEYLPLVEALLKRSDPGSDAAFILLVTKSSLLFNRGRHGESEEVLRLIMRRAIEAKSDLLMGYAYHYITAYATVAYSFQKAIFTGRKSLYYYERAKAAPQSVQSVLRYLSISQVQRAELDEARRLVERCEAVEGGIPAEAAGARSEYHTLSGDYRRGLAAADRCLSFCAPDDVAGRFFAHDLRLKALWQLCDFVAVRDAAKEIISAGFHSESALSQAASMLAVASLRLGDGEKARDAFVQAEIRAGQIRNDFEKLDALRTLALCRHLAGDASKTEEIAHEGLTLGLRHSSWWPTFTLLMVLVESFSDRGILDRARFWLAEAAHLFAAGFLLPAKDQILYYWFASKLGDEADSGRNLAVALRLFEVEKARIGDPVCIEAFVGTRSFAKLEALAAGEAREAIHG
ncbi:MAG TPA: adenylate/guanylate cyclase domain-containing protein [Rectinemataceae bacterium]|nr:adenylate/guanylate cyclase domain-containing protein [Rectinemataceae bacterium]